MTMKSIPKQPNILASYFRVGHLLHWSLILFILESWFYWVMFEGALEKNSLLVIAFWMSCFLFSFVHIFLVIMDGWSRFQNYKRAKDLFFDHGFNTKVAEMYTGSKCQRNAAIVAADELGYKDEILSFYKKKGVKWYHYMPYFMSQDPWFLFRNYFWERTFLEKTYTPKYNFHSMSIEHAL